MTSAPRRDRWLLVRRPLLLAFFLGCGVSLLASGRLSPRLILDGAISFAFVPVLEAAAFAVVYRAAVGSQAVPFARAMDRFFATNVPWLAMLVALAALAVFQPARQVATWSVPPKLWLLVGAAVLTIAWSAWLDFAFFRSTFQRSARAAARDVIVVRIVAWPLAAVYFLGFAIWPSIVALGRG
jgi:hypothetical protein